VQLAPPRASGSLTIERILRGPGFINSLCIRRATFERVGLFNTKYRFAADRDWMLRASMAGVEIAEFDQAVYRYLAHAGSSTMDRLRRNHAQMRREHLDIAARYLAGPNPKNAAATPALRRWHAVETGMLTWHEACAGKIGAAVRTIGQSTRVDLSWPLHLAGETARRLTRRRA
jgi:hypothetical protein